MKNTILSLMAAFLVLAVAGFALGEQVDVNLGAVYFSADGDAYADKDTPVTGAGTIIIENKNLTDSLTVKYLNTELVLDSENIINITPETFTITANSSVTKTLKIKSISDIEAGEYTGRLKVVDTATESIIYDEFYVKVLVPALEITEITITDTESGDTNTKLEKGQKFTVTVGYENIADQTDVENVNIKVGVYFGDDEDLIELVQDLDEDDLKADEDGSDLSAGKTGEVSFDFEMPFDVDDKDDFTVFAEITADAEDTDESFYARDTKSFTAYVPDDRIEITKFTMSPSLLACGVDRVKVSVEVRNIGDSKEDVELFMRNTATSKEYILNEGDEIDLDNDYQDEDDFTASLDEYVTLTDLKAGSNIYTLVAYYNDGDASTQKEFTLTSESCTPTSSEEEDDETDVVVQPTNNDAQAPTTPNVPASGSSYVTLKDVSGFGFDSDLVMPIVIGVAGLLVGALVIILLMPRA
ncbi:hypothetical protein JXB27_01145 [Candidatus Woesearchaeota archaeon]|nr:hypothetical protein [Candidatus Woesearchaeota archaeon]